MKSSHSGHRERLRERFIRAGRNALADYELLELLLFYAIPRRDVKGTAKNLLLRFGSLRGVLSAPVEQLIHSDGIGPGAAILFQLFRELGLEFMTQELTEKPVLKSPDTLRRYLVTSFASCSEEELKLLLLDKDYRLLDVLTFPGTLNAVSANRRELVHRLLACRTVRQVIISHNHLKEIIPSMTDIRNTIVMKSILQELSITLLDHVIVCGNRCMSIMKHSAVFTGDTSRQSSSRRH